MFLDVLLLSEELLECEDLTISQEDGLLVSLNSDGEVVHFRFPVLAEFFDLVVKIGDDLILLLSHVLMLKVKVSLGLLLDLDAFFDVLGVSVLSLPVLTVMLLLLLLQELFELSSHLVNKIAVLLIFTLLVKSELPHF